MRNINLRRDKNKPMILTLESIKQDLQLKLDDFRDRLENIKPSNINPRAPLSEEELKSRIIKKTNALHQELNEEVVALLKRAYRLGKKTANSGLERFNKNEG